MSQYPKRDDWGGARFARLVRNDREYWVEWVLSFSEDDHEEAITAFKHAASPQQAMQYARDAIADFHAQIARGEYYTVDFDVSAAEAADYPNTLKPGDLDDPVYLRFTLRADDAQKYIQVGHIVGVHSNIAAIVRETSLAGVAELATQLEDIPALDSGRWMLIW